MSEEKSMKLIENSTIKDIAAFCDERFLENIKLDEKQIKEIVKYATSLKWGNTGSVPLMCSGETCSYGKKCPFNKFAKPPIGDSCPWEQLAQKTWTEDYVKSMQVDINDKNERSQIDELVEADIMNARANSILALNPTGFILENPISVDPDTGRIISHLEEHVALKVKERVQARRDRILKNFVATRQDRLKTMKSLTEDPTEYMARLAQSVKEAEGRHSEITMREKTNILEGEVKNSGEEVPF